MRLAVSGLAFAVGCSGGAFEAAAPSEADGGASGGKAGSGGASSVSVTGGATNDAGLVDAGAGGAPIGAGGVAPCFDRRVDPNLKHPLTPEEGMECQACESPGPDSDVYCGYPESGLVCQITPSAAGVIGYMCMPLCSKSSECESGCCMMVNGDTLSCVTSEYAESRKSSCISG